MRALAAALLCLLTGWALVCLGWPKHTSLREQLLLKFSLSLGCGLGIFSLIFFLNLILAGSGTVLLATDVAVAGLLSGILFFRFRGSTTGPKPIYTRKQPARLTRILFFTLLIAFLSSMYGLVQRLLGNPHGEGWDAFAIWNLHARFLFLGRDYWKEGFTNLIPWSHPDYPLLLPASIAHFWTYLGRDSVAVPAVIALAFTISTLAILVSALLQFRGKDSACLAGIVLLGTPFFLQQGVSQYADVALSYFFLATIVLIWFHQATGSPELLALAGSMAGFAAWTKNEGQLFACALLVSLAAIGCGFQGFRGCVREVSLFVAGMSPSLVALAYFKIRIAPPSDLFQAGSTMLLKAADWHRYWLILRWYGKDFFLFGDWFLIPGTVLLVAFGWLIGRQRNRQQGSATWVSALTLALTAAGYFAIFVITPYDLRWHLRYSLNRLFLQLWPSALFVFFMLVRTPDEAISARQMAPSTSQ